MFLFLSQCDGIFFQQQTTRTARIADDDDDDDDVQKKACRVLDERAKGEKFLGTFLQESTGTRFSCSRFFEKQKKCCNAKSSFSFSQ